MKQLLLLSVFLALAACTADAPSKNTAPADPPETGGNPAPTVEIHPVFHGSVVLTEPGRTVFVDPFGGADRYADFPAPDLMLITHSHPDHLDPATLGGLKLGRTVLIALRAVADKLGDLQFGKVHVLENGDEWIHDGIDIRAVPMYNLPEDPDSFHPKGQFNGYVIQLHNRRYYFAGDTEDIPEMRNLRNIDVAFVPMNQPYTMTVEQAADAVLAFAPRIVYPYHYRNGDDTFSDTERFAELVRAGDKRIEVRVVDWY